MSIATSTTFRSIIAALISAVMFSFAMLPASAQSSAVLVDTPARAALASVYAKRADLRALFRSTDWMPVGSPKTAGIADLEDWARKYGHKEYASELAAYSPSLPAGSLPPALTPIAGVVHPVLRTGAAFDFSTVTASKVLVVDPVSRRVILAKDAAAPHPLASLTKLMTAILVLEHAVPFSLTQTITTADEVGGARLRVTDGTPLTVDQLFMTMLVGSANNAAHALSRSTGGGTDAFVAGMNAKAKALGLASTRFVDPTGIEVGNTSTAQDVAALLIAALEKYEIRKAASTAKYAFVAAGDSHDIKNTNGLLTDETNGLYVLGGKTGYLIESKWNLAVKMRDARNRPLIVVTFGSESKDGSFQDSERLARWVWTNATWVK